jgi:orotidine-5'-phosphate decarboxylase
MAAEASAASTVPPTGVADHPPSFGDRLAQRVDRRRSQLVLGLDPDPARLWPGADELVGERPGGAADRAARAVAVHCRLVLEAAGGHCVAVKLQIACFERLGAPGWIALREVLSAARDAGLLVLADAKRGDIDISARAYGQAFFGGTPTPFGHVPGLGADALTVSPLLGGDSLVPLLAAARAQGAGLFALVRTSNPGAEDVQGRRLASGGSVSDAIAHLVDELGSDGIGRCGLSDVGAVTGATVPERLAGLRERMPHAIFLLPGIGPQGGSWEGLSAAFAPGRAGGLVAASRAIVEAHGGSGATRSVDAPAAAAAAAEQLRARLWELYPGR